MIQRQDNSFVSCSATLFWAHMIWLKSAEMTQSGNVIEYSAETGTCNNPPCIGYGSSLMTRQHVLQWYEVSAGLDCSLCVTDFMIFHDVPFSLTLFAPPSSALAPIFALVPSQGKEMAPTQ